MFYSVWRKSFIVCKYTALGPVPGHQIQFCTPCTRAGLVVDRLPAALLIVVIPTLGHVWWDLSSPLVRLCCHCRVLPGSVGGEEIVKNIDILSPSSPLCSGWNCIIIQEQEGLGWRILSGQQEHELDTGGLMSNVRYLVDSDPEAAFSVFGFIQT